MTSTDQGASVKTADAKKGLSAYVVFERTVDDAPNEVWIRVASIGARSAEAAVKAHASKKGEAGTFVAVPARSWQPVKVTPKVVTTLEVEEVKP